MKHISTPRRGLLGLAAALAATGPAFAATKRRSQGLDLAKPGDLLLAYLKLRASTRSEDVFFWFTGTLDMCVPGQPIRPIVQVETLILRRTEKRAEREFTVCDWEASLYRDIETGAFIDGEVRNPITGRMVRPLHYREGPVKFLFTEKEPRVLGPRNPLPDTGKPFSYPHRIVGDDIWMTKESYIRGPHWLKAADYPLETSGERLNVATASILKAKWSEVNDPAVFAAPAEFAYTATSDWLPWMLMGQTPGFVVWHTAGRKYFDLKELPAETVAQVRSVHPQWFDRPEPWREFTNMYLLYKEQRPPEKA
jgi:hypothetical protein